MGNYPHPEFGIVALEFDFIVKFKRTYLKRLHFLNRKIKNHRFFNPFINDPPGIGRLGHTDFAFVQ